MANRHICPSKSLIRAPLFFVKKKEGSLHLVQDYWKLNEITIKNSYPLPLVSNIVGGIMMSYENHLQRLVLMVKIILP